MADEQVLCPDCGTPLVDLERRLEVTDADASHRHHAVDCVRVLKERVKTLEGVAEDMNRVELLEAAIRAVQSDRGAGHMSDKTIAAIDVALNGRDGAPSGG